ncbi:MAG: GlsB/YeaQ/YmgE family stress response membrane protein [Aggregatilineales bacterium]
MSPTATVAAQTFIVSFTLTGVITWLIVGVIAGFLATLVVRGRGYSTISNLIIGLVGAVVGGLVVTALQLQVPDFLSGVISIRIFDIVVAFIGAALILAILGGFYYRRWRP